MKALGQKFKTELTKIATSLEKDANGLLWIVENRQDPEDGLFGSCVEITTTKV